MTKIKICGLNRPEDILAANRYHPDYIGFVFAKSRRQVSVSQAAKLKVLLSPSIPAVGVFVKEEPENIARLYHDGIIDMIQLHGQEPEETVQWLKHQTGAPIIKAIQVESADDILKWQTSMADYLLLDHGPGGTGASFDWSQIPKLSKPYFLAGGLDAHNINAALKLDPFCLDISSGAETNGVKDPDKMMRLICQVRTNQQYIPLERNR